MTADWDRVKHVFQAALDTPPEKRAAFVREACGTDHDLRTEVDSLLLAHEQAGSFAEPPTPESWAGGAMHARESVERQLQPGDQLGPYQIAEPLGAGGMGEVFKARDTRLGRTVAIKLLPWHLRDDADLKQRFEREAKTLATLSHPHICPVFDVGHQDGIDFLVMEHLEGETLADRLGRSKDRRLQMNEALTIGIQIASALDAAHRAGIVHRDLKPGNVMLTKTGAKLLDFGLAKSSAPVAGTLASMRTTPPTLTAQGTILGTVEYMAPEQIGGKAADARTDLFAFGLVLFEMLTGRKAFEGDSAATLMGAILEREPPLLSSLQPLATPTLDRIVSKCLAEDPDERWQSAKDLCDELKWSAAESAKLRERVLPVPLTRSRRERAWMLVAGASLLVALGLAWPAARSLGRAAPEPQVVRLDVVTPPTSNPFSFSLSSDGRRLVFVAVAEGQSVLWVRSLEQASAQPLAGTGGADYPFWSPDGKSIGFFADGKLKRIDLAGGAPQVIADAPTSLGGTWNRDGVIVFVSTFNAGLMRVEASGGVPIAVTRLTRGQSSHRFPQFLPDGRRFLFFAIAEQEPGLRGVFVASLDGGEPTRALAANAPATYVSPGYLLQVSDGVLMAHRFDAAGGLVSEESVLVAQPVASNARTFRAAVSVSDGGVLAYRSSAAVRRQLVWADRTGKMLNIPGLPDETGVDFGFELAPDGQRVAGQHVIQQNGDIWFTDIVRGISSRFTVDPVLEDSPVWSPDGTRLVFSSLHNGTLDLFEKPLNGASDERPVLVSKENKAAQDWSWDGRFLLYATQQPTTRVDLWALPMTGERKPFPVAQTSFDEGQGRFSPDGRWVAYASNETGRSEIYVRAFPGPGDKWQVSKGGGSFPRWRQDGRELFYLTLDKRLMAAPVQIALDARMLSPGASVELFQTRLAIPGARSSLGLLGSSAEYAVARDGRFLLNIAAADDVPSPITVVLNWQEELKE